METCYNCDINKIFCDYDDESEFRVDWQPFNCTIQFSHNFVSDLAKMTKISFIKLTGANNYQWFNGRAFIGTKGDEYSF